MEPLIFFWKEITAQILNELIGWVVDCMPSLKSILNLNCYFRTLAVLFFSWDVREALIIVPQTTIQLLYLFCAFWIFRVFETIIVQVSV